MTDKEKFKEVVDRHGMKIWEVAAGMKMSPQSLYNKLANTHQFTQTELINFRELFPDVTDAEFKTIFFAVGITAHANE